MIFSFFWVFGTSLLNQAEHRWLKSQLYICNHAWAKIIFVDRVSTQNFNIVDLFEKYQKLHNQIVVGAPMFPITAPTPIHCRWQLQSRFLSLCERPGSASTHLDTRLQP
jgi:hypothetical protein